MLLYPTAINTSEQQNEGTNYNNKEQELFMVYNFIRLITDIKIG